MPLYFLMLFSFEEVSTCIQYWHRCPQNSLFPSFPTTRSFRCLVEVTLEGAMKCDEEKEDSCFIWFFFRLGGPSHCQKKMCWVTAMQLHSPPPDHTDVKEQSRTERTMGEKRLAFGHRNLTSKEIKNSHTTAMWNYTDLLRKYMF